MALSGAGGMGTATMADLPPPPVQVMGTLAAPGLALPPPSMPPCARFHCWVWLGCGVMAAMPQMLSNTISLAAELTFTDKAVALAEVPSALAWFTPVNVLAPAMMLPAA